MSFRKNGRKRDMKYVFGSLFLLLVGLVCMLMAARDGWAIAWVLTGLAVIYFGIVMFKNSNEV